MSLFGPPSFGQLEPDHLGMPSAPPMLGAPPAMPMPQAPPSMMPPSFGPSPMPPQVGPQPMGKGRELLMLLPALLGGIKDPSLLGAALRGLQKGKDSRRAAMEDAQTRADREARERAEFHSRMLEHAAQFDDEIELANFLQVVGPTAEYYGVPTAGISISDQKKANKDRKQVQDAVDTAIRRHGPEVLNRDDVSVQLSDGRTFSMAVARSMIGGDVTAGGKAIPVPGTKPTAPTLGSFEDFLTRKHGANPTADQITAARKEYQQADDRPAIVSTPNVGSFEDYVVRLYGENPTPAQITQARKDYNQSDDRPITVNTGAADARTNARIDRIVTAFNGHPLIKEYNETQAQQGIIKNVIAGQWSGPGDMATVFAFMKALDPNSVVRETEYANAASSGNIFMGWAARFNGALSPNGGFLSDQVRRDFMSTIDARMAVKTQQYQNLRKQLAERIDRIKAGAPETGDEALVDYAAGALPLSTTAPAAPSSTSTPAPRQKIKSVTRVK